MFSNFQVSNNNSFEKLQESFKECDSQKICGKWWHDCFVETHMLENKSAPSETISTHCAVVHHTKNFFTNGRNTSPDLIFLKPKWWTHSEFIWVPDYIWFLGRMAFCYQNCSDLLREKIVLVTEKNFWNSRLKAKNLQKRFLTVGQDNFGNKIA